MQKKSLVLILITAWIGVQPFMAHALSAQTLTFETHAAFFSRETNQLKAIDPHVYLADSQVAAGTGPQNIVHAAKFRPAFISDDTSTPVFNAQGALLGFTLSSWLGAKGDVTIKPTDGGAAEITAEFSGLRPGGIYSLFENHFDQKPIGFTPLDGQGRTNSFTADTKGSAQIEVQTPKMPTNVNAILLVYHSDGMSHGETRGEIGVTAHHQLIAKVQ